MNIATLLVSSAFAASFALIVLQDYMRASRALRSTPRSRVLRARAQFRPLPLSIPVAPQGIEVRPVAMRLVSEAHRLAA